MFRLFTEPSSGVYVTKLHHYIVIVIRCTVSLNKAYWRMLSSPCYATHTVHMLIISTVINLCT